MIQQEVSHREVQKAEENHVRDLADQMQEEKMVLMVVLKKDNQVHRDMDKDQLLILIMIFNQILSRD